MLENPVGQTESNLQNVSVLTIILLPKFPIEKDNSNYSNFTATPLILFFKQVHRPTYFIM